MHKWQPLKDAAAQFLSEPVVEASPVSTTPKRVAGTGAWGHEPLAGASVRFLAMTPTRLAIFRMDRADGGESLYKLLDLEIEVARTQVCGIEMTRRITGTLFRVVLRDGSIWPLEVAASHGKHWRPIIDALGRINEPHVALGRTPDVGASN